MVKYLAKWPFFAYIHDPVEGGCFDAGLEPE